MNVFANRTTSIPLSELDANFTEVAASSGVSFLQSGTGAVARSVQSKERDIVSVFDFMTAAEIANCQASTPTDFTTAIQAAITANQGAAKSLYFPAGKYLISSVTITGSLYLYGDGFGSWILTNSGTAHMFNINSTAEDPGCVIESIRVSASVTRTAGAYFALSSASGTKLRNIRTDGGYWNVYSFGTISEGLRITDCQFLTAVNIGILIANTQAGPQGIVDGVITRVLIGGTSGAHVGNGVYVTCCGDLQLDHVQTVYCDTGLNVLPGAADVIQSLNVANCLFDTGINGISISPGGGNVNLVKISNTWCASNSSNGTLFAGTGLIRRVEFMNCTMALNGVNGVHVSTTIATNIQFIGGSLAGNTDAGFRVAAGVDNFSIIGATIGTSGEFGANNYGVIIPAGASDNYLIANNTFTTNTTANFSNAGTGTNYKVVANIGVNDIGRLPNAQGTSTAAANNLVLPYDGTYIPISGATQINLLASTDWQGGSIVTLKFAAAPTVKHNFAVSGVNKPILLAGAVDFVASANDTLTLRYDSTDATWYEQSRAVI